MSDLDRIRSEASVTRDSLLTEDDVYEEPLPAEESPVFAEDPEEPEAYGDVPDTGMDPLLADTLRALLRGERPEGMLRQAGVMPSIAADAINEIMYDVIGDVAVDCDGSELSLVEDYREELEALLGGEA